MRVELFWMQLYIKQTFSATSELCCDVINMKYEEDTGNNNPTIHIFGMNPQVGNAGMEANCSLYKLSLFITLSWGSKVFPNRAFYVVQSTDHCLCRAVGCEVSAIFTTWLLLNYSLVSIWPTFYVVWLLSIMQWLRSIQALEGKSLVLFLLKSYTN